jgi:hypothetical protein
VIGGGGEMTAAMLSAQVHAGIAAPPHSFQLEARDFACCRATFSMQDRIVRH